MKPTCENDENDGNVIDKIGDTVMECLPECLRTEEFRYHMGNLCGLFCGYLLGRAIGRLLFPRDKEDEK